MTGKPRLTLEHQHSLTPACTYTPTILALARSPTLNRLSAGVIACACKQPNPAPTLSCPYICDGQEAEGLYRLLDADADGRLSYNDLVKSLGLFARDVSPKDLATAAAATAAASASGTSCADIAPVLRGDRQAAFASRDSQVRPAGGNGSVGTNRLPGPAPLVGGPARPGTAAIFLMRPASRAR